jgi:dTDP-4-dehydrorhamnose 3,5-epimerase
MGHSSKQPVSAPLEGVLILPLQRHEDERGSLTEIFRESWPTGISPVQWNAAWSDAGVLRGIRVHPLHVDYVVVLTGRVSVGLRDLRNGSPSEGVSSLLSLSGNDMKALSLPPGVAHGFYFHEPTLYVIGVSEFFDPKDELECLWSDPELEISWPVKNPILSERDAAAPSLSYLLEQLRPHQPLCRR